jgi:hypothetical protein
MIGYNEPITFTQTHYPFSLSVCFLNMPPSYMKRIDHGHRQDYGHKWDFNRPKNEFLQFLQAHVQWWDIENMSLENLVFLITMPGVSDLTFIFRDLFLLTTF